MDELAFDFIFTKRNGSLNMKALLTLLVLWSSIASIMIVTTTETDICLAKSLLKLDDVKLAQKHVDRVYFKENSR